MNSTLLRITPTASSGWATVSAGSTHAESLQQHIRRLRLVTTPLREIDSPAVRVDRDDEARPVIVKETMDRAFEVQASPKALIPVVREWLKSFE